MAVMADSAGSGWHIGHGDIEVSQPIVYIDHSSIREGKLDELQQAMVSVARFVETNMPRLISYGFFLNQARTNMMVIAVHPDSASLEFHLDTGREEFRKFAGLIELSAIEVYGRVSHSVLERLHQKARMLGNATVAVHDFCAGFSR